MQEGEINIRDYIDNKPIGNYKKWKSKRKKLVKQLGPKLLNLSEIELTNFFSKVEAELHELLLQSPTPEHELLGLLEISILHFFQKSYEQIKDLFPLISNQTSSMNRNVCRASTCCLRYMAEESIDNIPFLRESLEPVKSYLKSIQGNRFIFNALSILREVGRFIPNEVFLLASSHMSDIWRAACSDDLELRTLAVKLIQSYIVNAPSNEKAKIAESILKDCENALSNTRTAAYHGAIMICQTIYENFPSIFPEKKMTNLLIDILKAPASQNADLLSVIYDFAMIIAEQNPKIFEPKANEYLLILISQLMNGVGFKKLTKKLIKLIKLYSRNNFENIMVKSFVDFVTFIAPKPQYKEDINIIFKVLLTVLKIYPSINVPASLFANSPPCKKYLQCIQIRPNILKEIKDHLMEQFGVGIQLNASSQEQLVSILMVRLFNKLLFVADEPLYEMLRPLLHSPYEKTRASLAKTLPMFNSIEANQELIKLAVMDESKIVRLKALKYINPSLLVMMPESITQLLVDPSYKVRRMAIPLIKSSLKISVIIAPSIAIYFNSFFSTSIADVTPSRSAKTCSLLPVISQNFKGVFESYMPIIVWLCIQFLLDGDPLTPVEDGTYLNGFEQKDISKCLHHDMIANFFSVKTQISEKDINKIRVFNCENEKWIEKRNTYLFITLGNLVNILMPYLIQLLPVFIKTFSSKHSEGVYSSAIETLIQIVLTSESKINFLISFPDLLPSLLHLLSDDSTSQPLAISILKLIGSIGASKISDSPLETQNSDSNSEDSHKNANSNDETFDKLFDIKNKSFFTYFVMDKLINIMKKEATPSIFEALTSIFVNDTVYSINYLGPVIQAFLKAIEHDPDKVFLWNQLELICNSCEAHVYPFLDEMEPALIQNIQNIHCLKVINVLSYNLKVQFQKTATSLYPIALHLLDSQDKIFFKELLRFILFSIIFQHQCTELFIDIAEQIALSNNNEQVTNNFRISKIMKTLSCLLQLRPMPVFSARIARLALRSSMKLPEVHQVIYNLCIFGYMSLHVLSKIPDIPNIEEIKKAIIEGNMTIENLPFIKVRELKLKPTVLKSMKNIMPSFKNKPENIFAKPKSSQINNSRVWLEELCQQVVLNSPFISIRSCIQVIGQSQQFRTELFPIAFLACWKEASPEEKAVFSKIVKPILKFEKIDPQVISLVELVDRAGYPFLLNDDEIAPACKSTALALYFLERNHQKNPQDIQTIQRLLALNSSMGRIDSARGILSSNSEKLGEANMGVWSEQLGEWEKALKIYETQQPEKFTSLIKCYAHLELWSQIRNRADDFEKLDLRQKQDCALWYAWSFYHAKDIESVSYFMSFFPNDENDLNIIHFNSMFLIATEQFEAAASYLENGFRVLTQNLSVFNGSDAKEASRRMVFAQHLIELNEALQMKQDFQINPDLINPILTIWQNRLKNFSHESESWMKLIEIRSLVLSPADHRESYLKMLSVLRKERRWKLIDVYCNRFFSKSYSIPVLLARLKILWGRGDQYEAVELLKSINDVFQHESDGDTVMAFNALPPETRKKLIEFIGIKNYERMTEKQQATIVKKIKRDHSMNARLLRIQANWQYRLYTAKTSKAKSLIEICEIFEKSKKIHSNDFRTWAGWAYASSRSLSHFPEKRSQFALNAMIGFLEATKLRPSESLEYLCQMFSIFFRYGEEVTLPEQTRKDIIGLPAKIVQQIVPQIVVHIAHKDAKVSKIVVDIIVQFGSQHFQAVVFPLNLLSQINDPSKADVARKIMEMLGAQHPKQYNDAKLLIDGMIRSAISKPELWIGALDTASRAQQMNDRDSVISILSKAFDLFDQPQVCESDKQFVMVHGVSIQRCRLHFEKYKAGDTSPQLHRTMWDGFRALYNELDDKIKKVINIQLSKFAPELAAMHNFDLSIPGTYSVEGNSPMLDCIDPLLNILSSQQRPRSVYMYDIAEQKYKFLLKGNEDLRLDQRIMQFFNLINALLKNNRNTSDLGVSILDYAIVPLAPNAGLITWVTGADTFQQLVTDYRNFHGIRQNIELDIASQFVGPIFNSLSSLQRYEIYKNVASQTQGNELREMLWLRSPDPISWLQRNKIFTISTALMSIAGYTIGLGDRHPSNIMVQRHTGRCLHIDFGDSFEVAMKRAAFRERVPFRLTRMMINALDSGYVDGLFKKCCENILWVIRENKSSIIAQMEVFIHEPIFYGKEIRQSGQAQKGILERVAAKLNGKDPIPFDDKEGFSYDVGAQVDTLINIASDAKEYVRHYVGWCPFW